MWLFPHKTVAALMPSTKQWELVGVHSINTVNGHPTSVEVVSHVTSTSIVLDYVPENFYPLRHRTAKVHNKRVLFADDPDTTVLRQGQTATTTHAKNRISIQPDGDGDFVDVPLNCVYVLLG